MSTDLLLRTVTGNLLGLAFLGCVAGIALLQHAACSRWYASEADAAGRAALEDLL